MPTWTDDLIAQRIDWLVDQDADDDTVREFAAEARAQMAAQRGKGDIIGSLAAPGKAAAGLLRDSGITVEPAAAVDPSSQKDTRRFVPDRPKTGRFGVGMMSGMGTEQVAPAPDTLDTAYAKENERLFAAASQEAEARDVAMAQEREIAAEESRAHALRLLASKMSEGSPARAEKEAGAVRRDKIAAELRSKIGRAEAAARGGLEEGVEVDVGAVGKGVGHALEVAGRPAEALGAGLAAALYPVERSPWDEMKNAIAGRKGALGWTDAMVELRRRGLNPIALVSDALAPDDETPEDRDARHVIADAVGGALAGSFTDPLLVGKVAGLTRAGRAAKTIHEGGKLAELRGVVASAPPKAAVEALEKLSAADRAFASGSVAEQFRTGQRALIQVGGAAMPGTKTLAANVIGRPIDWISKGLREGQLKMTHGAKSWNISEGVRDVARTFRVASMLPAAEQDAMLMRWFSAQEQRAMASSVGREWVASAKGLDAERAAFDKAVGKASSKAEQQARMLDVFEKGPQLELDARVARALEAGALTPGEGKYLVRLRDKFDSMLAREQAAGVGVSRLSNEEMTYLTHVMTPEAMAELGKTDKIASFWSSIKSRPGFAERRSLDIGALEANAAARELGLKANLFVTDLPHIAAARELASIRATSPRELVQKLTSRFADESGALPSGVARVISDIEQAMTPQAKGAARRVLEGYPKWWKAWSLSPRPAFHARNIAGNIWNNALGGVWHPGDYDLAMRALTSKGQLGKSIKLRNGESKTLGELVEEARSVGADKTEFGGSLDKMREQVERELGTRAAERAGNAGQRAVEWAQKYVPMLSADEATNVWLKAGMATGDFIERHARLTHYIAKRRAGLSAEQAGLSVKRYLFDYSDLTDAERGIRDLALPFYGWMRNNAALQVTKFIEQPWKFTTAKRAIDATEDPGAPPTELYPEWMQQAGVVRTSRANSAGVARAYTLSGYWPGWDLSRVGEGDVLSGIHPAAGLAAGLWSGVDTFSGKRISGLRSETRGVPDKRQTFLGGDLPATLAFSLRKLLPVFAQELDRANPGGVFGRSPKGMNEKGERIDVEGEAPTLNLLAPFGVRTAEGRDRADLPWQDRLAQYLFGIRPYSVDLSREARWRKTGDDRSRSEFRSEAKQERAAKNFMRAAEHEATAEALRKRRMDTQRMYLEAGVPLYSEK